jgi:hypothetical protein
MPRIRTLKPEHRQHRKVGPLSDREYRLWVSMILEAEDSGRLVCDATQLRAVTWPYHPRVSAAHVEAAIQGLACTGMIRLYEHHGVRYADFPSWGDHQRIDHPARSRLPAYPPFAPPREGLANMPGSLANMPGGKEVEVEVEVEGKGMEGRGGAVAGAAGILANDPASSAGALAVPAPVNSFRIPSSVAGALAKAPRLGSTARIVTARFWQAEIRAHNGIDFAGEVLNAEAWIEANPKKAPRSDLAGFLHRWFKKAKADLMGER